MNSQLRTVSILVLFSLFASPIVFAQDALKYLEEVSSNQKDISKKYMSYISAASHGKSARKVEKRRIGLISTVLDAKKEAQKLPAFKGEKILKDGLVEYLGIVYNILNEDYDKIVNMEDIAEQSYDAMEAYFMAQDLAGKKQDEAHKKFTVAYESFAKKNNINLINKETELDSKLKVANQVNDYYHKLYLIFFKAYKQEAYLMDAISRSDLSGIGQNKNTLEKYAEEALTKLDTIKGLNGDKSILIACAELMKFYKDEVKKVNITTDFLVKNESFNKMNAVFSKKADKQKTQKEVDEYNKQIKEINAASNVYNSNNQYLNNERAKFINRWNSSVSSFLDKNIPTY
jgi:hypothetical protein